MSDWCQVHGMIGIAVCPGLINFASIAIDLSGGPPRIDGGQILKFWNLDWTVSHPYARTSAASVSELSTQALIILHSNC